MLQPPAIIDVEASGPGRGRYPIEVGCVLPDGRSYCALIQPAAAWKGWDPAGEAVHGVSRADLLEHGLPPLAVAIRLNALLHGTTVYTEAWGRDYCLLAALHEVAGVPASYRVDHLARITPEVEAAHWRALRAEVEQSLRLRRHRASVDARIAQMTWLCLISGLSNEG